MSWEKKMDKELIATLETVLVHLHSIRNKLAAHPERYDYYMSQVQKYEKVLHSLRSYALVYSKDDLPHEHHVPACRHRTGWFLLRA